MSTSAATSTVAVTSQGWLLTYGRRCSMQFRPGRGAQKGAHYSAPRPSGAGSSVAVLFLTFLGVTGPVGAAPPAKPEAEARRTEQQLQAVRAEIERISREVAQSQVQHDRLAQDLKSAELSVGEAREAWLEVRRQRAEGAQRRAQLATEKHARESDLADNRAALKQQIRAAYELGRQEPLKLLLTQQDPAVAGRMFAYYGYFGRARAGQIHLIEEDVERIAELEGELAAEDAKLEIG